MRSTARVEPSAGPPASVVPPAPHPESAEPPTNSHRPDPVAPRRRVRTARAPRRPDTRTLVSVVCGLIALAAAALLVLDRPEVQVPPEVAGTTVTLEQRLVGLAGELRSGAGLPVPVVDPTLSAAAADLDDVVGEVATVDGWTVVATAVVTGSGLDELWAQLSGSPDHRVAIAAPSIRGWGIHVSALPDGTLRAAVIAAR